jgi:hypothetical protein
MEDNQFYGVFSGDNVGLNALDGLIIAGDRMGVFGGAGGDASALHLWEKILLQ